MRLVALLSSDRFAKLVELRPPKGVAVDDLLEVAGRVAGRVGGFVVPDNPGAIMTVCATTICRRLIEAGHCAVLGLPCRDRNRIALQSMLLGASIDGVRDVLVGRGTEPAYGDHPSASAVYDVEPHEVLDAMRSLASGKDMAGNELRGAPVFDGGAEVNPWLTGEALKAELAAVEKRVGAGARFLFTPPVHDVRRFRAAIAPFAGLGVPLVARVMLLKSVGMARYLNRNVAGDSVPDDTIARLRKASDKVEAALAIAADTARALALEGPCRGVCFQPLGWEDRLPSLMDLA